MKNEKGQSLVELAVAFVVLMFLLVGAVELSFALFQFIQLRDAAQEGAIFGSVKPWDTPEIVRRVRYASDSPLDLTSLDVTVYVRIYDEFGNPVSSTQCRPSDSLEVTVTYPHKVFIPFFSALTGIKEIPLESKVTSTVLQECEQ